MPNGLVHADIWDPARTASHGGSKYSLTCYDDHTKHVRIYFMKANSEALQSSTSTLHWCGTIARPPSRGSVQTMGAKSTSQAFQKLLAENGILANKVLPDAHSQNSELSELI
jgi:hypothetical protein